MLSGESSPPPEPEDPFSVAGGDCRPPWERGRSRSSSPLRACCACERGGGGPAPPPPRGPPRARGRGGGGAPRLDCGGAAHERAAAGLPLASTTFLREWVSNASIKVAAPMAVMNKQKTNRKLPAMLLDAARPLSLLFLVPPEPTALDACRMVAQRVQTCSGGEKLALMSNVGCSRSGGGGGGGINTGDVETVERSVECSTELLSSNYELISNTK